MRTERLLAELRSRATDLGFSGCRITAAALPDETGDRLDQAISSGYHGSMTWLETTAGRRRSPVAMWPQARSAILLAMNYGPQTDPLASLEREGRATISVYARNRDYHDLVKGKLKELAGWLAARTGEDVKVFVDTAPLMEKPLAELAGLGWQGKHTNLVSREMGSWLFLGSILTCAVLPPDEPETDHCGNCRACIDICPTDAFPAPYQLDARRCISYLTIEHKEMIPLEFRKAMGNRIFGCDDCLAVCPWNKFAREASEAKLRQRQDLESPALHDLVQLDDTGFRKHFSGSPVKRIGRERFVRNVLIAVGNSGQRDLAVHAGKLAEDDAPVVRAAAVWALGELETRDRVNHLRERLAERERNGMVLAEWKRNG